MTTVRHADASKTGYYPNGLKYTRTVKEVGEKSQGAPLQELGTIPNSPGEPQQVNVRQEDSLPAPDNMIHLSAMVLEVPPMSNDNATKQERRHSE
ncbi:hypothetical protein HPB50_028640 [Hyalomma asiaticum]|nr:hypothetical protein HPB50_028640 [Hyalomma asiaticum]